MIVLRRIEPQRNMHRFCVLSLEPDLFGTVSLVKEWGRRLV
jgi:predicted DNA-binding WGR domain protein